MIQTSVWPEREVIWPDMPALANKGRRGGTEETEARTAMTQMGVRYHAVRVTRAATIRLPWGSERSHALNADHPYAHAPKAPLSLPQPQPQLPAPSVWIFVTVAEEKTLQKTTGSGGSSVQCAPPHVE